MMCADPEPLVTAPRTRLVFDSDGEGNHGDTVAERQAR